jgi:RNA polymerase sigma factor (TIGR02999 family)
LSAGEVTNVLAQVEAGDTGAANRLMELVYDDLRGLAGAWMRQERNDHTLQPTAIVNEAYLRLVDQTSARWQNQAHFFAVAARVIRRILVDHARSKGREKRGGDWRRVTLGAAEHGTRPVVDVIAIDEALERLADLNERHAQVVEMRFFGGLSVEETAHVLGVSEKTVKNDWRVARAWLRGAMEDEPSEP